ncbi:patatin-like phospholipase family protein [Sphingomonas qilianensis]|uniref:patatin-like phospholipase family protein n=1 Tax=Sphingomonas qilianensis TaxID=1736690 RepID=UPI0031F55673
MAIAVSACSLSVKPKQYAGVPGQPYTCLNYAIAVGISPPPNGLVGDPFLDRVTAAARTERAASKTEPVSDSMLFLSGGSQHGAFGAGFMQRWSEMRGGSLPRFRVVTGISTGALQSTLVFIGEPGEIVNRYAVVAEGELLQANTAAQIDGGGVEAIKAAVTIVKKGALAELVPLRGQLLGTGPDDPRGILTAQRLGRVAQEAGDGRKLFAGAVELDTGLAVAFDLTKMAEDYVAERSPLRQETLRKCYAEALVASSSVPIAAQPSFIEGKMFIDGGARFGVLPAQMLELGRRMMKQRIAAGERPNLFVVVNGTLQTTAKCDLADCKGGIAGDPIPPTALKSRAHGDWSFPALAFRSLSILINQSYVSSVELARRDAAWCQREPLAGDGQDCVKDDALDAMNVHFVRILPDEMDGGMFRVNGLRTPIDSDRPFEDVARTCADWSREDEKLEKPRPHEFHPRYMRCLIRYGAKVAENLDWAKYEPQVVLTSQQ